VAKSEAEAWRTVRDGFLHIQRQYSEYLDDPDLVQQAKDFGIFGSQDEVIDRIEEYRIVLGG
jgi:alkanesulfonate monooxygenase SsuD/methylene tetrahydromethanopterin reductase-like flavin-dependent oxidoreductase (luciferase family)